MTNQQTQTAAEAAAHMTQAMSQSDDDNQAVVLDDNGQAFIDGLTAALAELATASQQFLAGATALADEIALDVGAPDQDDE